MRTFWSSIKSDDDGMDFIHFFLRQQFSFD